MDLTTFTNPNMTPPTVDIPAILTVDYNGVPLSSVQLTNLVSMAHFARGLYNTNQLIAELEDEGVNPEYVRGQVELIIQAVKGLSSEDDVKEAVEALIFNDFTHYAH